MRITKRKLMIGGGLAAGVAILAAVNAPKAREEDLAFRWSLESEMHQVMTGKATLNLAGYEIDTTGLFLDAGTPTDMADKIIENEGYTTEDPHSPQAYTLAACAVSAATGGGTPPPEAITQYTANLVVEAGNTCLASLVTGITNGTIQEVKAPVDLAPPPAQ